MCGIIGYIGDTYQASKVVLDGLERLEYRGYDSAGVATILDRQLKINRDSGKLKIIRPRLEQGLGSNQIAIGHTRWATHGKPSEINAHPHVDNKNRIVVVHNGIIENYVSLKKELQARGHVFKSETDTEIVAHLLAEISKDSTDFFQSLLKALSRLQGAYALAILNLETPERIYFARKNCPLIIGTTRDEGLFLTSDVSAVLHYTRDFVFLNDGEAGYITKENFHLVEASTGKVLQPVIERVDWNPVMAEKGGFKHFMLKEIHEQPDVIRNTIGSRTDEAAGKIVLDEIGFDPARLASVRRIIVTACGTAFYSGLVGKYIIERLVRIPVECELASEFRYRDPILGPDTLVIAVSQSGETADTLAAIELAKASGCHTMAVVNVKGSTLTRKVDSCLYIHAGPEIGVASTKAYMAMLVGFELLGLYFGQDRLGPDKTREYITELKRIPGRVEEILKTKESILELAQHYFNYHNFLYLGRDINFPSALEGALKLKEISYIHAEGYASGEMKHGPIALLDKNCPVVAIMSESPVYDKILSNVQEAKARDCKVIGIVNEDGAGAHVLDDKMIVPKTCDLFSPLLNVVPLQLFAYYVANLKGADVDQPRNLAKSVTVE